jgi:hypothetical protein
MQRGVDRRAIAGQAFVAKQMLAEDQLKTVA